MSVAARDIGAEQLQLIRRSQQFLDAQHARGVDVALDPECYLNSWAPGLGHARLRRLAYGWRAAPALRFAQARDSVALLRLRRAAVQGESADARQFEQLVVSWALPTDFDADGAYKDRYLGLGSVETPRTLWFLLLLSGAAPARLSANVRVFHRPRQAPRSLRFHARGRRSAAVVQADDIASAVAERVRRHGCKQVVMPYEAQPFQHAVNLAAQACDAGVRTVGYLHSALPALPTDYLCRPGAPDRLLVHGPGQAEILARHLGWEEGRLQVIESLRYLRDADVPFAGRILLPYSFGDADFIVRQVDEMLAAAAPGIMPRWQVRNHPVMTGSATHLALATRLQGVITRHADRASDEPRAAAQTLMIGATAAVIEALERGLEVVHVCAHPLFERQSPGIWSRLEVENLTPYVYRYRLREPGAYIRLGGAPLRTAQRLELAG